MKHLLALILFFTALSSAAEADVADDVNKYLHSKAAKAVYSPVYKAALEAQSAVKPLNQLYAGVLLGAPELALSAVKGGLPGLGLETSKKTLVKLTREFLGEISENPAVAARKIANHQYDLGMKAYRRNYETMKRIKKGESLNEAEAGQFLRREMQIEKMPAARQLISDINTFEYDSCAEKVNQKAVIESMESLAHLENNSEALASISTADLITQLQEVVRESQSGLESFIPYKKYKERTQEIESSPRYAELRNEEPTALAEDILDIAEDLSRMKDSFEKERFRKRIRSGRRKDRRHAWDRHDIGEMAHLKDNWPAQNQFSDFSSYNMILKQIENLANEAKGIVSILSNPDFDYDMKKRLVNPRLDSFNAGKNKLWNNLRNNPYILQYNSQYNLDNLPDVNKLK